MSKTKVIDKLTPEQEAKIPEYVERFRAIGLCTRPTDRTKAEEQVRRSYEYFNKLNGSTVKDPQFVWAESPMAGAKLAAQYTKGSQTVTDSEVQEQASTASYGSFEAYWVSTWAFITEQLPVQKDELTDIAIGIISECGVYWTFEDLVVLTPKPTVIEMKDQKLHCTTGPALAYPNGDCLYAFEGTLKGSLMEVAIANRLKATGGDQSGAVDESA